MIVPVIVIGKHASSLNLNTAGTKLIRFRIVKKATCPFQKQTQLLLIANMARFKTNREVFGIDGSFSQFGSNRTGHHRSQSQQNPWDGFQFSVEIFHEIPCN